MRALSTVAVAAIARRSLRATTARLRRAAVLAVLAALMAGLCLTALALALWVWLAERFDPLSAALSIAGVAALAAVFFALAARATLGRLPLSDLAQEPARLAAAVKEDVQNLPPTVPLAAAGIAGLLLGLRLGRRR